MEGGELLSFRLHDEFGAKTEDRAPPLSTIICICRYILHDL